MSPTTRYLVIGGVLVALLTHWTGNFYVAVALVALIPAARYWWSIKTHPFVTCRRCAGTASHRDPLMPWAKRECYRCLGSPGKTVRWGSRTFTRYGKSEHRAVQAKRTTAREAIRQKR